ncbi:hypothetical protein LG634_24590 [Streptomyces bambusae]|uniref:hypothetical protein n=1 Tax=Streptomyces bambusae TaxID=1550616 RepID=UPI001CFCE593|nr:hypothetical protein [Streptomyces bambusae]MCB5167992.1 hypothetical protein [Streptomyces bambusae]
MALNVGELVATIRADDSGWRAGLAAAQLRLRGLTTDADGRLRDLRGRFVTEGEAAGRSFADGISAHAERAVGAIKKIGPAAAGISAGVPAAAALATALGSVAAGAVAAQLGVQAFKLAAQPQLEAMTEASEAAQAAEDAHAKAQLKAAAAAKLAATGGEEYKAALAESQAASKAAKDADAAYQAQLADLPPATRAAAMEQAKLKKAHQDWSDSLAGTTMPVFTQGMQLLRQLLPQLTPFVKAAATAFSGLLTKVSAGVKSAGFKQWAADMAAATGPAITNFVTALGNIAKGFMGLMQAFLPTSAGVTGGLVAMTAAFANWGTSLKGSEGFAQFLQLASAGGQTLGTLAEAAVSLLVALGPVLGVTTQLVTILAQLVSATPLPVLQALAAVLVVVKGGLMAHAAWLSIVAARTRFVESAAGRAIMAWARMAAAAVASAARAAVAWVRSSAMMVAAWVRMNAVGLASMARIAAASTAAALRSAAAWTGSALASIGTWVAAVARAAAASAASFVMMAARAVVWAAQMAASWIVAMGPVGWIIAAVVGLVALIVMNWDRIKAFTVAAWDWIWQKVKSAVNFMVQIFMNFTLPGLIMKHWNSIKSGASAAWSAIVGWLRRVPSMIYQAFLNFTPIGLMIKHWTTIRTVIVQKALAAVAWLRGLPGMMANALGNLGSLLYSKGTAVVQGLWRGIQAMGGWIRGQLMAWARRIIPGPIAKALGIASPSKVTTAQGRWIARGLIVGMTGTSKQVRAAATRLADIVRDSMRPGRARNQALATISRGTGTLLTLAAREERLAVRMRAATAALADQIKARDKLTADVKAGVLDSANITKGTAGEPMAAEQLLGNLRAKMEQAKQFAAQLAQLRKKGVRSDLIAQIAQAGVEQGASALAALSSANAGQIREINATQAQLVTAAGQAGSVAGEAMYGAGIQAARGLIAGLQKEKSAIERQMLAIAKGMSAAIRKALGIRSPSRVMASEVGRHIPAGIAAGIRAGAGRLDATMAGLVDPSRVSTTVGGPGRGSGAVGGGAAVPSPRVIVEVRGPAAVRELIRDIVIDYGGGDVVRALGRA